MRPIVIKFNYTIYEMKGLYFTAFVLVLLVIGIIELVRLITC